MRYYEIQPALEPYKDLRDHIPCDEIQGKKVAGIFILKLEECFHEIAYLTEKNAELTKELYGKRKNNQPPDDDSETSENLGCSTEQDSSKKESESKKKLAKSRSKKKLPAIGKVKSQTVRRRVPEGLVCSCCNLPVMDQGLAHKASEVDLVPAEIIDREYLLHRGTCQCGQIDFTMPRPVRPLENRNYSSSLLAKLIIDKFRYHLPIYRQMKQVEDMGFEISRNTLNEAVLAAWEQLKPIVDLMWRMNRVQPYRYLDETPICRIINKKISKRHYLWGMYSDLAITFELTATRNQEDAKRISGSGGHVMTDGLGVYNEKTIDGKHSNCLAHLVQQFFKAFSAFPQEAEEAIDFIVQIYSLDSDCQDKGYSTEQKLKVRQEQMKPLMDQLLEYLQTLNVPPRSAMGRAIKYADKRWKQLCMFLTDGEISLDNNIIESIFKDVKLGMKNCLFVQSDLGGKALAGFYSLISTCELHGINPFLYISETLDKLAGGWPMSKIDQLLPWNFKSQPKPKYHPLMTYIEEEVDPEELIKQLGLEGKVRYEPPIKSESPPSKKNEPKIVANH